MAAYAQCQTGHDKLQVGRLHVQYDMADMSYCMQPLALYHLLDSWALA